jgi:periplasmic protein TonB
MKLFLLIVVSFIFINDAYSQKANVIEIKIEIGRKRKITKVDVDGDFPGGDTAWRERITKSLSTSNFVAKRAKKGKYTVRVAYVVVKDGGIAEVKCINDPGYGMCNEAVRVIRKSPVWEPATQGVRQVRPLSR